MIDCLRRKAHIKLSDAQNNKKNKKNKISLYYYFDYLFF